jgi:hypothetical protein
VLEKMGKFGATHNSADVFGDHGFFLIRTVYVPLGALIFQSNTGGNPRPRCMGSPGTIAAPLIRIT